MCCEAEAMTPCPLVGLSCLLLLGVIAWLVGRVRMLQSKLREHALVERVLHERRIKEP